MNLRKGLLIIGSAALLSSCSCHPVETSEYARKTTQEMMNLFDGMFEFGNYYQLSFNSIEQELEKGFTNISILDRKRTFNKDHNKRKLDGSGLGSLDLTKEEFKKVFLHSEGITDEELFAYVLAHPYKEEWGEGFTIIDSNTIRFQEIDEDIELTYFDYENCHPLCPFIYTPDYPETSKFRKRRAIDDYDSYENAILALKNLKNHFSWDKKNQKFVYNTSYAESDKLNIHFEKVDELTIGISKGKISDIKFSLSNFDNNHKMEGDVTMAYETVAVELPSGSKIIPCAHNYRDRYDYTELNGKYYRFYYCDQCGDHANFEETNDYMNFEE